MIANCRNFHEQINILNADLQGHQQWAFFCEMGAKILDVFPASWTILLCFHSRKQSHIKINDILNLTLFTYSQTRIKCSRPISSLPGLQGQKPKAYYYFTFWNSTISVFMKFLWDQPVLSYSTHGSQKSAANQKKSRKNHFSGSILKCL